MSRHKHGPDGGRGTYDIDLWGPSSQTEPRREPLAVVVRFDQPVQSSGILEQDFRVVQAQTGAIVPISLALWSGDQQVTLVLDPGPVQSGLFLIRFPGLLAQSGACHDIVSLPWLVGDVNSDGLTNIFDLMVFRICIGQFTNDLNFRADVNSNGWIDVLDMVVIRSNLNRSLEPSNPATANASEVAR